MKLFTQFGMSRHYIDRYKFEFHSGGGISEKKYYLREQKAGQFRDYIFIADIKE